MLYNSASDAFAVHVSLRLDRDFSLSNQPNGTDRESVSYTRSWEWLRRADKSQLL